jgi:hypothetical protein
LPVLPRRQPRNIASGKGTAGRRAVFDVFVDFAAENHDKPEKAAALAAF